MEKYILFSLFLMVSKSFASEMANINPKKRQSVEESEAIQAASGLVIKKRFEVNIEDLNQGQLVAYANNLYMIKQSRIQKVNIEYRNCNGETPLHIACRLGSKYLVRFLLDNGANIKATICTKDEKNSGDSLLHIACKRGNLDIIEILLEYNVEINEKNDDGVTPSQKAWESGNFNVVEYLWQRGINSELNETGETPLTAACRKAKISAVDFFVLNYMDMRDRNGKAPIQVALELGHFTIVKFLLSKGADISGIDFREGLLPKIAFHVPSIAKLLLEYINNFNIDVRGNNTQKNTDTFFNMTIK